jgi:tripartite ATP-independent transporter DctM subunit
MQISQAGKQTVAAPTKASQNIDRLFGGMQKAAEVVVIAALVGELSAMFGNMVARSVFGSSLLWSQEVSEVALVVMTFIGGAIAYPRNEHMALHAVVEKLPASWRPVFSALVNWQVFFIALAGAFLCFEMMLRNWDDRTPYMGLSLSWFALPMVAGFVMVSLFALQRLLIIRKRVVLVCAAITTSLVAALLYVGASSGLSSLGLGALAIAFVLFAVQLLMGVPIGFTLLMVATVYLFESGIAPVSVIPINMRHSISSFVMLAIPFFILAGYIMTEGGLSKRLTQFVISLVGGIRGGLLQVVVVCMYIMSGISGSKVADVAAVGTTMKDVMKENRYHPGETAAVLASSAIMGETVPPSIAMLVLASVTSLSIGTLFVAGLLPAAMMALCLMVLIYFRARKSTAQERHRPSTRQLLKDGANALPALITPLILIGGIVSGVATPTEVSSTAVVYALVLSTLLYKELRVGQLRQVLTETAAKAGMVLFITATASTFSWSLTIAKVPQQIATALQVLHGFPWLFMIGTIAILTFMGALLEGLPALLIFGPLLLPLAPGFGISPLQYGIVMIIAMGLGAFSPPLGVGMYVTCSICDTTVEDCTRHMIPYLVVLVLGLLMVAFVPWFSLILPKVLQMSGQ